jgi:hypothetical protein
MAIPKELLEQLGARRNEISSAVDALRLCEERVRDNSGLLESPRAAAQYLTTFINLLTAVVDGVNGVVIGGEAASPRVVADTLRRLAARAEAEETRCREFSDKWVQKPLPFETVRPLLTQMVSIVRHQLGRVRALEDVANRIESSAPPDPDAGRFDRRTLFSRFAEPLKPNKS